MDFHSLAARHHQSFLDPAQPGKSKGLSLEEARMRLERDGPNELAPPKRVPWYHLLLKQFKDPFLVLLMIAAGLEFLGYALEKDITVLVAALVLVFVIFLTAFMAFHQELQTAKVQNLFNVSAA